MLYKYKIRKRLYFCALRIFVPGEYNENITKKRLKAFYECCTIKSISVSNLIQLKSPLVLLNILLFYSKTG